MIRKRYNNVVSLSGCKDSTAMLLMMLEHGEKVHSIVFFDTGWEFPQMLDHIEKLKEYIWKVYGAKIWTLHPKFPFEYWLTARPIKASKGPKKGKIHRIGFKWPSSSYRWCTGLKVDVINSFTTPIENAVQCVGYAADESKRSFSDSEKRHRFPLQEYGVTEAKALEYCFAKGFDWGGLYNIFHRVSCFCCPLQRMSELRIVRKYFPDLWSKMLEWDAACLPNRGFKGWETVHDLDKRFNIEEGEDIKKLFQKLKNF